MYSGLWGRVVSRYDIEISKVTAAVCENNIYNFTSKGGQINFLSFHKHNLLSDFLTIWECSRLVSVNLWKAYCD
jgi:hypothetical protein